MKQCLPPITIDFPTWVTQKQYRTCQMRLGMLSPLSRWAKISHCCHDTPRAPWICSECLVCTGQPVSVNKNQLAVLELLKSMKKSIIDGCQSLKVPKGPPDFHALVRPNGSSPLACIYRFPSCFPAIKTTATPWWAPPWTAAHAPGATPTALPGAMWLSMSTHPHKFIGDCLL